MVDNNFKARYEVVNGKKILVVECKSEQVVREDGTKDVVIHAPSLAIVNKFMNENNKKEI